jgi:sporulation integral membrane protein YlbJ
LKPSQKKFGYFLAAFLGFLFAIAMIIYPESAFTASGRGLDVWWNIVFPALLPFFIAAEVLTGLGVVHFIGVLLEPLMRPVFRVPGIGAFVMAVGLASGFPIGAVLAAKYRERNDLSKEEGERLMSFTNTADPLFMSGAVAVGMLGWPQIGFGLAIAHYLSSLSTGLIMRFYKPHAQSPDKDNSSAFIFTRAARALIKARQQDNRPFGKLMGDAIIKSINALLLVGGFIISFSVLIDLFNVSGIIGYIASALSVQKETLLLLTNGLLEITMGCQQAAQSTLPMSAKIITISAIIAWSGLSVHGQVASIISATDMSLKPFLAARVIQGVLAAIYTAILFRFNLVSSVPAFAHNYVSLSLKARYWLATATLLRILGIWAGAGLASLLLAAIFRLKVSAFKVSQSRN